MDRFKYGFVNYIKIQGFKYNTKINFVSLISGPLSGPGVSHPDGLLVTKMKRPLEYELRWGITNTVLNQSKVNLKHGVVPLPTWARMH